MLVLLDGVVDDELVELGVAVLEGNCGVVPARAELADFFEPMLHLEPLWQPRMPAAARTIANEATVARMAHLPFCEEREEAPHAPATSLSRAALGRVLFPEKSVNCDVTWRRVAQEHKRRL